MQELCFLAEHCENQSELFFKILNKMQRKLRMIPRTHLKHDNWQKPVEWFALKPEK